MPWGGVVGGVVGGPPLDDIAGVVSIKDVENLLCVVTSSA